MKTRFRTVVLPLALILGWLWPQCGQAFYNASTGRWISRDPIEEFGGVGVYVFVDNQPTVACDHLGLLSCRREPCINPCGDAPDEIRGTDIGGVVCCGGKAHACVWRHGGITGAGNEKAKKIVDECGQAHEDRHLKDVSCPAGDYTITRAGEEDDKKRAKGECYAYGVQRRCLRKNISQCDGDPQCIKEVLRELKEVKAREGKECAASF